MTATFYVGDAVTVMNTLPEKSVDLILSSPPFLSLRSYLPQDHPDKALEGGSQASPAEYIDWLIEVVEACARVLALHGSLVFELGDTFAGSGGAGGHYDPGGWREGQEAFDGSAYRHIDAKYEKVQRDDHEFSIRNLHGKKQGGGTGWPLAKSLSLIPETFRFAMVYGTNPHTGRRTEPWRLRNVIRWIRPNPPVGALGDKFRPATSELMVFCKTKDRFFDLDAVRETPSPNTHRRNATGVESRPNDIPSGQRADTNFSTLPITDTPHPAGAPPLDWWNIPPGGYPGAHYAVWPPELLVKPIKAMCPEKVCRRCGEARRRIAGPTEYLSTNGGRVVLNMQEGERLAEGVNQWKGPQGRPGHYVASAPTLGWTDCGHDDWRPGLVLDPFAGSGTTLSVATGHGRDAIGIDLDERNYELALDRVGPLVLTRAA